MTDMISTFEQAAKKLPKAQRNVAGYIVKHPLEVPFMTVEQLAHETGVSTTTVMRLAANLGFSGYTDMIRPLRESLVKEATPLTKFTNINQRSRTATNFAETVIEAESRMLSETIKYNDYETIKKVAAKIENAEHVYIIGFRMSYPAMAYLYHCLQRIKDHCVLVEPGGFDMIEKISRIGENDVVVGCVLPRYYSMVPEVLSTAKTNGASTVLLTDSYSSPAVKDADIVLLCDCVGASFHASILGVIYLADYITACIARENPEQTTKSLDQTEKTFNEYRNKIM